MVNDRMNGQVLADFLNEKVLQYQTSAFIDCDPVSIPHQFSRREDIEVAGFLTATISWGNRAAILKSANTLMQMLDYAPHQFVMNASEQEIETLQKFYYRTFNGIDVVSFIRALRPIYREGGMERLFVPSGQGASLRHGIANFRQHMIVQMPTRSLKHLSDVAKGSSGKRLNMFLRWMVRPAQGSVDFGLWQQISPRDLYLPLDVHTARVGRSLGLLTRRQNDWKAVEEITSALRGLDANDPVKYDFALFGLGVFEKFGA